MDAKDRILQYAEYKGFSASTLEKEIGLSRNYFRNTGKVIDYVNGERGI